MVAPELKVPQIEPNAVVHLHSAGDIAITAADSLHLAVHDQMMTNVLEEMWTVTGYGPPHAHWHDGELKWESGTLVNKFGGERWDLNWGTKIVTEGMLTNEYAVVSKNEVLIDPFTWLAGLTPKNWTLSGKVPCGRTEAVYGSRNVMGFGPHCWTTHGPALTRIGSTLPWEWAGASATLAACTATTVMASPLRGLRQQEAVSRRPRYRSRPPSRSSATASRLDRSRRGLCLALGNHLIRHYAGVAVKDAASVATFLTELGIKNSRLD